MTTTPPSIPQETSDLRRYQMLLANQHDIFERLATLDQSLSLQQTIQSDRDLLFPVLQHLPAIIPFETITFYLVNPETREFDLHVCRPEEHLSLAQTVFDWVVQEGTFAWALRQNRAVVLHAQQFSKTIVLHSMSTPSRRMGMFLALIDLREITEWDLTLTMLSIILQRVAFSMENKTLYRHIEGHNRNLEKIVEERTRELHQLAVTDPLTGLHNRRHFFDLGSRAFLEAKQSGLPLSALMLDIDHFKMVNDTHGHSIGDRILQGFSRTLQSSLRKNDICARLGGEEFSVLLPECSIDNALPIAERICRTIEHLPIPAQDGDLHSTVSVGVSQIQAEDQQLDNLLQRSDKALYAAKSKGRNRVECL